MYKKTVLGITRQFSNPIAAQQWVQNVLKRRIKK